MSKLTALALADLKATQSGLTEKINKANKALQEAAEALAEHQAAYDEMEEKLEAKVIRLTDVKNEVTALINK